MSKVQEVVSGIRKELKQVSSSQKDEIVVMQAMLNDPDYEVGVYGKGGQTDTYNPCKDFRGMCTNIVSSTTKMPKPEATELVNAYQVTKGDAETMVNVSKEYLNAYLDTGRKIKLGGRETSDFALSKKEVPESLRSFPRKPETEGGKVTFGEKRVPAHSSLKAYGSCPKWVK